MQEINGPLHQVGSADELRELQQRLGNKAGPVFVEGEELTLKNYVYRFDRVTEDGGLVLLPVRPSKKILNRRERRDRARRL